MNRNAAIVALAASIAAGLLIVRSTLVDGSAPAFAPSVQLPLPAAGSGDEGAVLENAIAPSEKGEVAPALEPEVLAVKVERRSAVDEAGRVSSRRNEPMRLVSGVVRDETGRPVQDAVVLVTEVCEPDPQERRVAILASGQSDESGRFEVRTTVRLTALQARARKSGFVDSASTAFHPGASGLVLVLDHGGVVSGRLLLDRWMKLENVTVELSIPPGPGEKPDLSSVRVLAAGRVLDGFPTHLHSIVSSFGIDADGRFVATGITRSTVDLAVYLAGESEPAISIPSVAVRREGETSDARLDPLDLRGKFEPLVVDVFDESGNGLTGASVFMSDPGSGPNGRKWSTQTTLLGGRAEFLTRAGPHDIEVESEGFRRARLDSVNGNQVVRLRKGIPVHVRIRGSDARPAQPDILAVGFLGEERDDSMPWLRNVPTSVLDGIGTLDDPHETTFLVASPGIHQVEWYLKSGKLPVFLNTGSNVTVDVLDQDALQEFVLDLPGRAEKAWIEHRKVIAGFVTPEVR